MQLNGDGYVLAKWVDRFQQRIRIRFHVAHPGSLGSPLLFLRETTDDNQSRNGS
jgi:hypothetical protein